MAGMMEATFMSERSRRSLPHIFLLVLMLSGLLTWAFARAVPGARPGPIVGKRVSAN